MVYCAIPFVGEYMDVRDFPLHPAAELKRVPWSKWHIKHAAVAAEQLKHVANERLHKKWPIAVKVLTATGYL